MITTTETVVNFPKEDYALEYFKTIPDKDSYTYGTKNRTKFAFFLSKSNINQEAYDYWISKVGTTDPLERKFIDEFIKYHSFVKKAITMNGLKITMLDENNNKIN